jgi:Bacterial Ig-like domain
MYSWNLPRRKRFAALLTLAASLTCSWQAHAQPTLVSVVPANGATGVSTATTVVFTFNVEMDPDATDATFFDLFNPFPPISTTSSWSANNKVLTCTPTPSFPVNKSIFWTVSGQSAAGDPFDMDPFGSFTTGSGGSSGTGTNAITRFTLGITHAYDQTSTALPTPDATAPYSFGAITSLSSNRTATNVLLTLPTGSISNLVRSFFQPENFTLFNFNTSLTTFNTTFPSGNYLFNVQAAASNQMVTVNFPGSLVQPGAPHVSNYAAAQTVDASQPFTLTWDAFPGGTAADFVSVAIGDSFSSTNAGLPGALPGTATSISIPAGTLQAGSNYDGTIGFYRFIGTTNGNSYGTLVYRATTTEFTLTTRGGSVTGPLVLTNAAYAPSNFAFDVLCSPGQIVTVEYRTNLAAGLWRTLLTTTSAANRFRAVAPQAATNRALFFRARNGP